MTTAKKQVKAKAGEGGGGNYKSPTGNGDFIRLK